nr:hypothetical protein CFP56_68659 [Quercus suber]
MCLDISIHHVLLYGLSGPDQTMFDSSCGRLACNGAQAERSPDHLDRLPRFSGSAWAGPRARPPFSARLNDQPDLIIGGVELKAIFYRALICD